MDRLLIHLTIVLQPATLVSSGGIMVGPMNDAAELVPFIHTVKLDDITVADGLNSGRTIDVMCNQYGVAGGELQNKALMAISFVVVGQNIDHYSAPANLGFVRIFGR